VLTLLTTMVYIEKRWYKNKVRKGAKYYLCKTIRIGKHTRKVSVYLAAGTLNAHTLSKLQKQRMPLLEQKINEIRGSRALSETKHLNRLIDNQKKKKLENIRNVYTQEQQLLSSDEKRALESNFLTDYAFQTTKIEGSTLSAKDAQLILEHGQVPKNKELRDVYGLRNIVSAWKYISAYKAEFDEKFIKEVHRIVMMNILEKPGTYREVQVYLGRGRLASKHIPPPPDEISQEMKRLVRWVRSNTKKLHPIVLACFVHHLFIAIHPFIDGNGRSGRLILHFLLHQKGFPPVNILNKEKMKYIYCLEKVRDGNPKPFIDFIVEHLLRYKSPLSKKIKKKRQSQFHGKRSDH